MGGFGEARVTTGRIGGRSVRYPGEIGIAPPDAPTQLRYASQQQGGVAQPFPSMTVTLS